jgi:hypothetical protein
MRMPIVLLILIMAALPASAEVFRCEIDGTIVFSDTACQPDAQPYTSQAGISVISRPADLEQTAERNREFIARRLERQVEIRQARAEQARAEAIRASSPPGPPAHAASRVMYVPYHVPAPRREGRGHHRRHAQDQTEPAQRQQRFSALSGPFPGTRRRSEP